MPSCPDNVLYKLNQGLNPREKTFRPYFMKPLLMQGHSHIYIYQWKTIEISDYFRGCIDGINIGLEDGAVICKSDRIQDFFREKFRNQCPFPSLKREWNLVIPQNRVFPFSISTRYPNFALNTLDFGDLINAGILDWRRNVLIDINGWILDV